MKLRVLFDKEKMDNRFEAGWGLSFLIGDTLFDTGEKFEYLLHNMKILDIKMDGLRKIVISHNQWNHLGGLWGLLSVKKDLQIYGCSDFHLEFQDKLCAYSFIKIEDSMEISKNIYTTGPFKAIYKSKAILEQSLIVKTENGISIICACAHMGLIELIKKVKSIFPKENINFLTGGFHLIDTDMRLVEYIAKEVKKIGIKKVAPSHCSGHEAAKVFKDLYGDNFVEIKSGVEIDL